MLIQKSLLKRRRTGEEGHIGEEGLNRNRIYNNDIQKNRIIRILQYNPFQNNAM